MLPAGCCPLAQVFESFAEGSEDFEQAVRGERSSFQ